MRRKRNKGYKRMRVIMLTALLSCTALAPAGTAYAIGPGETGAAGTVTITPGSSGGPGETAPSGSTSSSGTGASSASSSSQTNPYAWKKVNGVYQSSDGSTIRGALKRGIDVSRWQGAINWSQVAADDVSFVMLGTRSKGAVDPYFHQNIQNATAAGVQVGVYIYSLATTVDMAVDEANFVLELIHDYPISYPVAFDLEDSTQGSLSKAELAQIANAFCKTISDAGYYPIIYANENWLKNKLDMSLMNYPVWVARYAASYSYQNPVMWQATSTGAVSGISGNVDIDFQFFDFTSVIPANTWRTIGGKRYYYQNYAKQKNTWAADGTDWYYLGQDGLAFSGWVTVSGEKYYLNADTGKMETGWHSENGKWYYLTSSGAMATGWVQDGALRYYMNQDGEMQTGWMDLEGQRYLLADSGAMATGWAKENGIWYYLGTDGSLKKGWIQDGGQWYYTNANGEMQTGWITLDGAKYYLKGSGAMATGWRQMDGGWYYFTASGQLASGIIEVNGLHYYMDPSAGGKLAVSTQLTIDGTLYQASADGVLSQVGQQDGTQSGTDAAITAPGGTAAPETGASGTGTGGAAAPGGGTSAAGSGPAGSGAATGVNGGPGVQNSSQQAEVGTNVTIVPVQ